MKKKLLLISLFFYFIINGQVPNTDVWIFELQSTKQNTVIKSGKNITNRVGYDNQPSFSSDSKKIYFTCIKDDSQADIYYYNLNNKKIIQLTKTVESEYSPTPSHNNKLINCVTVLKDSSQIVQSLHLDKNNVVSKTSAVSALDSVGYFTFLNTDNLVYFILTQPHSIRIINLKNGVDRWLVNNPVRVFNAINRHTLIYGLKDSAKVTFYKYDFLLYKSDKYAEFNSVNEDIIWHDNWGLLKSEEKKILRYDEYKKEWIILFDLSLFGIKKITRFNFDLKNKYLVLVDNL